MPLRRDIRTVMIIGSGPVVIGQGAEFDYAGSEACRALKDAGYKVLLVNNNPATIMTDPEMAHRIYFEPLIPEFVERIVKKERPDALIAGLGGQTGLNLARALAERGVLQAAGTELIGTPLAAIEDGEDRDRFRARMRELGEPVPASTAVQSTGEALFFAEEHGFPLVVRPAYTLGGTGGGHVHDLETLQATVARALQVSPIRQALIETSLYGLREIEFEVVRDARDQAVVVAVMENVDPVGVHTGDSVVVAPAVSLSDAAVERLSRAAVRIVRAIGIVGGANVQFAYDPERDQYWVIELNPRVSRSSALASKATGYPIAYVSALLAVGMTLDEITLPSTGRRASEPPVLADVVVKWPRFPFDAFPGMDRSLGTEMRATGETMTIGRSLAEALLKGVRALEVGYDHLEDAEIRRLPTEALLAELDRSDDRRLFRLIEALRRGTEVGASAASGRNGPMIETVVDRSGIPRPFVEALQAIVDVETALKAEGMTPAAVRRAKELGMADSAVARFAGTRAEAVRRFREENGIVPCWTDGGRTAPGKTPPLWYATYDLAACDGRGETTPSRVDARPTIVVLGAGPIRIGQGLEFDYATVHAVLEAKARGYRVAIVNTNPETVSTDYTLADAVYVEPVAEEDVLAVLERERPLGVLVQFGGQTALRLAHAVAAAGYPILGTPLSSIDQAEDREKFDAVLNGLGIERPRGIAARTAEEALFGARSLGFPLVVRPSYVLGGREMTIVHDEAALKAYVGRIWSASDDRPLDHPLLIDRYIEGEELEVDAISDGETVFIPGIIAHVERAGVHSGDSIARYPATNLAPAVQTAIVEVTSAIARALQVRGLLNVQFVVDGPRVYVLEANPRASRTLPFLSKATGLPLLRWATAVMLGESLSTFGVLGGLYPEPPAAYVKAPVFSFAKLASVDVTLGPVMKSTGEVMARDDDGAKALYKALLGAGAVRLRHEAALFSLSDRDKAAAVDVARALHALGIRLYATPGTAAFMRDHGLPVEVVGKIDGPPPTVLDLIASGEVDVVINTWTAGTSPERDGFRIRRAAVERGLGCFTSLDTARAFALALQALGFTLTPLSDGPSGYGRS
ncbi:MAG: carbamoyl-phosphate synthase large subunit [Hydrogenibacillus sp.]|nr:carbamoyl-phosphate synthase large subunit [Hydrogenibacillus sp.]